MRTLQEKYNAVLEGNFSKTQFKRDAAIEMPQFVSNVNSFEDTVSILKNKGTITEAKKEEPKYSTAKPADQIAPDVLDTGIKFELDKKYGTLDVTPEQYAKCREMAIKNLSKDVLYYVKQDSIQLEEPGEKMEKAKLNEVKVKVAIPGQDEFEAEEGKDYSEEEADKYIANAKKSGATPMNTKFIKVNEETDEAIQNIENDEQTKRRVAGLVNQLLQSVDPRDETVKAYAISVKNDLESGDPSRLSRYKDVVTLDDVKDDMEHYISHDVDQLEEESVEENAIGINDTRLDDKQKSDLDRAVRGDSAYSFGNDPYADDQLRYKYAKKMGFLEEETYTAQDGNEYKASYNLYVKGEKVANFEDKEKAQEELKKYQDKYGDRSDIVIKPAHDAVEEVVSEGEWEDKGQSKELNKKRLEDLKAKRAKGGPKGAIAVMDKQIAQLEKLVNEGDIKLSAEDMEKLHKDGKITLPNGSVLHFVGKADEEVDATEKAASDKIGRGEEFTDDDAAAVADKMPKIKKGTEFKLIGEDEPDAEDLYQHDDEYLATLKQRKALKEMFKKIITKVIND